MEKLIFKKAIIMMTKYKIATGIVFAIGLFFLLKFYLDKINRVEDLKQKGFAREDNKLSIFRWNDIYFLSFKRALSETDFRNSLNYFSEKFDTFFVDVREIKWVKFVLLQSIMVVKKEKFPKQLSLKANKNKWIITLGIDAFKNKVELDLSLISEIFISGKPGSGKTHCANIIIEQLKEKGHTVKIASSKPFDYSTNDVIDFTTEAGREQLIETINEFTAEMKRRKEKLIAAKKTHAKELNLDAKILLIDECHLVLKTTKSKSEDNTFIIEQVERLIRQGRAFGVVIILATQKSQIAELNVSMREGVILTGKLESKGISTELFSSEIAASERLTRGILAYKDLEQIRVIKIASEVEK